MSVPQQYQCRVCDRQWWSRGEYPPDQSCERSNEECPYKHEWGPEEKELEKNLSRLYTAKRIMKNKTEGA